MGDGWRQIEAVADLDADLFEQAALRLSAQRLDALLGTLSCRQERVLRGTYGVGCVETPLSETARQLGLSKGTVAGVRDTALRTLARRWGGPCPV